MFQLLNDYLDDHRESEDTDGTREEPTDVGSHHRTRQNPLLYSSQLIETKTVDETQEVHLEMTELSVNHDACVTFCTDDVIKAERNCIRLTSGRTDLRHISSGNSKSADMSTNSLNGALDHHHVYPDSAGDNAPLLGPGCSDNDDSDDHCHAVKSDSVAEAANKRATVQLTIAAVICALFMAGEFIGKFFLKVFWQ